MANVALFRLLAWVVPLGALVVSSPAFAQELGIVGGRALGLGGAFVAVANDSSATWWNPAGLAVGPFVDVAVMSAATSGFDGRAARRHWGLTVATPAFGAHYVSVPLLDARPVSPTGTSDAGRQEGRVGPLPASLSFRQFGATVLHSVFPQVHVGTTLKLVGGRGTSQGTERAETHFDADVGVVGAIGAMRIAVVGRQLFAPRLWRGVAPESDVRLERQVRVGVAFDGDRRPVDAIVPVVLAFDADLRAYDTVAGPRRELAGGGERWWGGKRVGVRGGARVNTIGAQGRAATFGVSVAVVRGVFAEGHAALGSRSERGWAISARATF